MTHGFFHREHNDVSVFYLREAWSGLERPAKSPLPNGPNVAVATEDEMLGY
jgi:hypothetical protein